MANDDSVLNTSITMSRIIANFALVTSMTVGLTIGSTAHAAKTAPVPDFSDVRDTSEPASQDEVDRAALVNISQPPPLKVRKEEADYFYRYRHSLSFRAGVDEALNDLTNPGPMFGFLYWFPTRDLRGIEAGAELTHDGTGTVHVASRTIVGDGKLRWFYKVGGGVRIIPKDQMVTLLKLRNWQLRGSSGFEWTLSDPISLRADVDGILSTDHLSLLATLGLAFAW